MSVLLIIFSINASAADKDKTIIVFGDSLSAAYGINYSDGWVSLLEKKLADNNHSVAVVNASISGNTSGNGLGRIENVLDRHQPDIFILELGGNDGLRGHPPKRLESNLKKMITICKKRNIQVLLVAMQLPPSYGKRYTEAFANVYPKVAEDTGVPLVNDFVTNVGVKSELMQRDGIHPNKDGQPLLLNNIWPYILELL